MKMYFYKGSENIKKIKIITIIGIIIILFSSGYTFAKYVNSKKISYESSIAVPVLEVEGTELTKISALNSVGYYNFIVKNYNEKRVSDVAQKYWIEIISKTDESISFELYQDDKNIELNNNKTNSIYIEGINKTEHNYKLKVSYDKTKVDSQEDILEDVQIKVHSEQVKV